MDKQDTGPTTAPVQHIVMRLCDELRGYREDAGLTVTEIAERLGVSRNTATNWESGTTEPTVSQWRHWRRECGLMVAEPNDLHIIGDQVTANLKDALSVLFTKSYEAIAVEMKENRQRCQKCGGTGKVREQFSMHKWGDVDCSACRGRGY